MEIGRRIYYDKETGNSIVDTGERKGYVKNTTVEQDIKTYKALSERNRDAFDYIEFEYGLYAQDFAAGRLVGVNVETKLPIFEYPNPENPEEPIIPEKPLSDEIEQLKHENELLKAQNKAMSERADFVEDVVAELAIQVYQ